MTDNFVETLIEQAKKNPYFHLEGYMERYWLYPFSVDNPVNVRIHHILRSDDDRHLHDHPWPSTSVVLKGGYWEILPADQEQHPRLDSTDFLHIWRGPGSVVTRKATDRHLLELPEGQTAWSMFIMGPVEQKWGFYTEDDKVYWREYLNDWDTKTASDY